MSPTSACNVFITMSCAMKACSFVVRLIYNSVQLYRNLCCHALLSVSCIIAVALSRLQALRWQVSGVHSMHRARHSTATAASTPHATNGTWWCTCARTRGKGPSGALSAPSRSHARMCWTSTCTRIRAPVPSAAPSAPWRLHTRTRS